MENAINYNYRFLIPQGEEITVDLTFDEKTYRQIIPDDAVRPDWARLEHHKCDNCPLDDDVEWCPAALSMAQIVPRFSDYFSYEKVMVEVETPSRKVSADSTLQRGLASLLGLVLATSGCPRTRFLRPMARFHLPLADEQETVFRSLSIYLLHCYVANRQSGASNDIDFDELREDYDQISTVNGFLAERIRSTIERDAAINAVAILDLFAAIAPSNMDCDFKHIANVFVMEEGL